MRKFGINVHQAVLQVRKFACFFVYNAKIDGTLESEEKK